MLTAVVILLLCAAVAVVWREFSYGRSVQIEEHYLRMLLLGDSGSERYVEHLMQLSGRRHRMAVAKVVSGLIPIIYRFDPRSLDNLNQKLSLSSYLLDEVARHVGKWRVHYMLLLSRLSVDSSNKHHLDMLLGDKNRMVSFFALLSRINSEPQEAMRHIAAYPRLMNHFELSYLLASLTWGSLTLAYQPMLGYNSENVRLLGLAVVRHFSIEGAEQQLRSIIAEDENHNLRREALYVLASMNLLLSTPNICSFVGGMGSLERRRFVRYIASVGYSQSVVDLFAASHDRQYFHSLVNSYKSEIRCL